jgi:predicted dienelactone hydrolase/CubicO group peptidase (beta-lactamase class C family)
MSGFKIATEDADWLDAKRDRRIPVRVYAPALAHGKGPFPVVVFSHGGGESREAFTYLGTHWARHGYLVIFLTHEGSDRESIQAQGLQALGGDADAESRPLDMRFVIDRVLSAEPGSPLLKGRIDAKRLAVAGQCAGSTTALALVGLTARRLNQQGGVAVDPRVKCALALSPQPASGRLASVLGLGAKSWADVRVPTMVISGTRDFNWVPEVRRDPKLTRMAFDGLPSGDNYLVEIRDAEHNAFTDSVPYYPARQRDPRHHGWIQQATTAMLDAYLGGSQEALAWLRSEQLEQETQGECCQERKSPGTVDSGAPAAAIRKPHSDSYDFRPVDTFLEESLDRMGEGCCLLLVHGNEVVYRKAFGTFAIDQTVPIASASKWISAAVVLSLVDEGKLSLDDTVSKYLPNFRGEKAAITIRQLFSHTNGFSDRPSPHRNTRLTMAQAVDQIAEMPLEYSPGTALLYSGAGMQVAGRICEIASGKKWADLFQEEIGGPLRMTRTNYDAFGKTENPNVAGSVETCVDDYGRFLQMILNRGQFEGRTVLSEQAVRVMLTNQTGDLPIRRSACQPYAAFDSGFAQARYGIGCWLEQIDPATGQAQEATSGGALGCMPFVDVKRDIAGVYLPYHRAMKRDEDGVTYNDAAAVFLELRPILRAVFDGQPTPAHEPSTPAVEAAPESDAARTAARMIEFFDRDDDGGLSADETPPRLKPGFSWLDLDHNGSLSPAELTRGLENRQNRQRRESFPTKPPSNSPTPGGDAAAKSSFGPYGVRTVELVTLEDARRGCAVPLRITFPKGNAAHPLVLFSHCVNGGRDDFRPLVEHWASHGYICMQPDHVDSRHRGDKGRSLDWRNRAQDLVFVLDSLDEIQHEVAELNGMVNRESIGVAGHLIGAYAASLLVGMQVFSSDHGGMAETYRDERVKAAILLSPQGRGQGLTDQSWAMIDRPMLIVAGSEAASRRTGNPAEWRAEPFYLSSPGEKYLLWIEGLTNRYAGLATGAVDDPAMAATVKQATVAYWNAHLQQKSSAREYLMEHLQFKPGEEGD